MFIRSQQNSGMSEHSMILPSACISSDTYFAAWYLSTGRRGIQVSDTSVCINISVYVLPRATNNHAYLVHVYTYAHDKPTHIHTYIYRDCMHIETG
jgi:hypothetical protein